MLVKYNGVELPDLPQGVLEDYPYVFIRKDNTNKCYDLSLSNRILYYSSSPSRLNFPVGTAKWYQIPFSATIDENTEWVFNSTYYGGDYWNLNSNATVMWSMFDIPSGSVTSTTIYFAGSPIEYPAIKKYLVRNNDAIYTVVDGSLVEVSGELNANLFINSGIDEIPDGTLLMTLSDPEVLCWTNEENLPTLTATVKGTPHTQTIISDKIYLTDKSITGIESALATCEGDLIVAVSFDDKQTWKAWNGEQWVTLSDDNTGMSKETLEGITFEQWNELYTGATGFYVRVSLLDTTQSVEKIVFDFSN